MGDSLSHLDDLLVPFFGALEPDIEYSIICSYFGQSKHIRNT